MIRNQKCKSLPRTLDAGDEHKDVGNVGGGGDGSFNSRNTYVGEEGREGHDISSASLLAYPNIVSKLRVRFSLRKTFLLHFLSS